MPVQEQQKPGEGLAVLDFLEERRDLVERHTDELELLGLLGTCVAPLEVGRDEEVDLLIREAR